MKTRRAPWPLWPLAKSERGKPEPLVCFRVRAERRSRLCICVEVYRGVRDLRRASRLDATGGKVASRTFVAQCAEVVAFSGKSADGRVRKRPEFAVVRLTRKSRTRDITHECFHATLRWATRAGYVDMRFASRDSRAFTDRALEERMAVVHENLCAGIVEGMYDLGVYV